MALVLKNVKEFTQEALRELGELPSNETIDRYPEDERFISNTYRNKYNELVDREYAYWEIDKIPDACFLAVRDLIVNEIRHAYGYPIDPAAKEAFDAIAVRRLLRHTRGRATNNPTIVEYF